MKLAAHLAYVACLCVQAEVSSCRQRLLPPLLSYSWSCVERPSLSSSSADPRRFRLEPGTLPPGTYLFAVSVTSDIGGPNAEASVTVVVKPSPLVVLVAGGDRRTLGHTDSLTLDASASFDPDRPRGESAANVFMLQLWGDGQRRGVCLQLEC